MDPMMLTVLDGVVIVVLLYAIYYMRIVARSMTIIREGKSEMQQVLKEMTQAIAKAEDTVQGMKRLADDRGRALQKQMDDAQHITEELKFINQAADHVAQRLEKTTTSGVAQAPAVKTASAKSAPAAPMSKAEKELAAAIAKRKSEAR